MNGIILPSRKTWPNLQDRHTNLGYKCEKCYDELSLKDLIKLAGWRLLKGGLKEVGRGRM